MEFFQNILKQTKSNDSSPMIDSSKLLINHQQHHRTKAVTQNIVFNSLSQNPSKFYTITMDETKTKDAMTSKLIEKNIQSKDQKRLIIENLEEASGENKDFMNLKFGKKYYTSKLKNPLYNIQPKRNNENNGNDNCFTEKNHSDEKELVGINLKKSSFENISKKKNDKDNCVSDKTARNNETTDEKTKRKSLDKKFGIYLDKLKNCDRNLNLDNLKMKFSSKKQLLGNLSKSLSFQKLGSHKFISKSIAECNPIMKKNDSFDYKLLGIIAENHQMKKKIKALETEIIIINEKNEAKMMDIEKKNDFLEYRLKNVESILNQLIEK